MSEFFLALINNQYIQVSAFSWFLAQVIKTLLNLVLNKQLNLERMVGAGGMPSAHSAFVISLMVITGRLNGWDSFEVAVCFALAAVVMYDATGVRHAAGQHAKMLNQIVSAMYDNFNVVLEIEKKHNFDFFRKRRKEDPDEQKQQEAALRNQQLFKELLGHTLLEVAGGVLLGILVAGLYPLN